MHQHAYDQILIKHEKFLIQICMKEFWSNFDYVMKLKFQIFFQIDSKKWNDVEIFFHSFEMISKSIFILFEWNENVFIQLSFQLRRKFLALFSTRPGLFRGVIDAINDFKDITFSKSFVSINQNFFYEAE